MHDHNHKEMSEEKKEKLTAKLKELGVDAAKSREILDKVVDKANNKDLVKVREWHEKHKAEHDK